MNVFFFFYRLEEKNPFKFWKREKNRRIYPYKVASYIGETSRGRECANTYQKCPFTYAKMHEILKHNILSKKL